jgi:hypothetical protein
MILVISHPADSHTEHVLRRLAENAVPVALFDLSDYPQRSALSLSRETGVSATAQLTTHTGSRVDLNAVSAVWWRRPQRVQLHPELTDRGYASFAQGEIDEAIAGLWLSLPGFWINQPLCDQNAARKAYQLQLASEIGCDIPKTLITSDPQAASDFITELGVDHTVYKSFSATAEHWRETRILRQDELSVLGNVRFAPVIFQEYIPADVDLRITIVDGNIFAAAIYSQQTAYRHDFRMDMISARVEPHELPLKVQEQLTELMNRLGLVYGAIDMRRTPEGRYVFLEINPAGQWLFVEQRTGQPITDALCSALSRRETPWSASNCAPELVIHQEIST